MKKKKSRGKKTRRKFMPEERKRDARRWLVQHGTPENLLKSYAERYRIPESEANIEILELGYGDAVRIQYYEQNGIEWEYRVDGYSGDMKVVPKGTPDWELNQFSLKRVMDLSIVNLLFESALYRFRISSLSWLRNPNTTPEFILKLCKKKQRGRTKGHLPELTC
jgi:hypothetical protein